MYTFENQAVVLDVGVGGGHNKYRQDSRAHLQRGGIDTGTFILGREGTPQERSRVAVATGVYQIGCNNAATEAGYSLIRAVTNGRTSFLDGSEPVLKEFPGVIVSCHSMAATNREGDLVVLGDAMAERPKSKKPLVLAPTDEVVAVLQDSGYKAINAGWLAHPKEMDEQKADERLRKITAGEALTILIALTGQTPWDHRKRIDDDVKEIAEIARDWSYRFIFYTATNKTYGDGLAERLERQNLNVARRAGEFNGDAQAAVLYGDDFSQRNALFLWGYLQSHFMFRMLCETTATLPYMPAGELTAKNPNSKADSDFANRHGLVVPSAKVMTVGIPAVIMEELIQGRGTSVIDRTEKAREAMRVTCGDVIVREAGLSLRKKAS